PGWIANNDHVRCDIARDDRAGADYGTPADDDARQERGVGADPGEAADPDALEVGLGVPARGKARIGEHDPRPEPAIILEDRVLGDKALRVQPNPVPDAHREFDHRSSADRTVIADLGVLADQHAVAGLHPGADPRSRVDHGMRSDDTVRADLERVRACRTSPGRLAEHAEIVDLGPGAEGDVRKQGRAVCGQASWPW